MCLSQGRQPNNFITFVIKEAKLQREIEIAKRKKILHNKVFVDVCSSSFDQDFLLHISVVIKIFENYFLYILPTLVTFRKIFYAEKGVGMCVLYRKLSREGETFISTVNFSQNLSEVHFFLVSQTCDIRAHISILKLRGAKIIS